MKLRNQLLLMNLLSTGIMLIAIWYSEMKMLLRPEQTQLFIGIVTVAMAFSTIIYWLLTRPIRGHHIKKRKLYVWTQFGHI